VRPCRSLGQQASSGCLASARPFAYIDVLTGERREAPQGVDAVPKPVSRRRNRVAAAVEEAADVVPVPAGDAAPDPDVPAQPANRMKAPTMFTVNTFPFDQAYTARLAACFSRGRYLLLGGPCRHLRLPESADKALAYADRSNDTLLRKKYIF
jgi:hypothetical protein